MVNFNIYNIIHAVTVQPGSIATFRIGSCLRINWDIIGYAIYAEYICTFSFIIYYHILFFEN